MSDSDDDFEDDDFEPGELASTTKSEPGEAMEQQEAEGSATEPEQLLLPGDQALKGELGARYVLGVGLRACMESGSRLVVRATRAGYLRSRGQSYWLDCPGGRYQPLRGDCVLGIVCRRAMGDVMQVDIGCLEPANLSLLSFENATKRNRPDVRLGDLVYCRLTRCDAGLEPELACVDSGGRAAGFGVVGREPGDAAGGVGVSAGVLVAMTPDHARRLAREPQLLELLKTLGPFEAALGCNGRLWLRAASWQLTVALAGAAAAFQGRPVDQCQRLLADMRKEVWLALHDA